MLLLLMCTMAVEAESQSTWMSVVGRGLLTMRKERCMLLMSSLKRRGKQSRPQIREAPFWRCSIERFAVLTLPNLLTEWDRSLASIGDPLRCMRRETSVCSAEKCSLVFWGGTTCD